MAGEIAHCSLHIAHCSLRFKASTHVRIVEVFATHEPCTASNLRSSMKRRPPSPALSPGEREKRFAAGRGSGTPRLLPTRRTGFPLPEGEGQGEGERSPE